MSIPAWRKSTQSGNVGDCVEVAVTEKDQLAA
jgi:hypothetical protein